MAGPLNIHPYTTTTTAQNTKQKVVYGIHPHQPADLKVVLGGLTKHRARRVDKIQGGASPNKGVFPQKDDLEALARTAWQTRSGSSEHKQEREHFEAIADSTKTSSGVSTGVVQ